MQLGAQGPEVGNLQRFLRDLGYTDPDGRSLVVDESFGKRTEYAVRAWQLAFGLSVTGVLGTEDRVLARSLDFVPFVSAKHQHVLWPARRKTTDWIVVHCMQNAEKPEAAEDVALWFAGRSRFEAPVASCHFCVDSNSVVQCVREGDVAWHAPGANHNGIGIEHAGRSEQTAADWSDSYSTTMLEISAKLAAKLAAAYNIPISWVAPDELRAGVRGFTSHANVSLAFGKSSHHDPGLHFPVAPYLERVRAYSM